MQNMHFEMLRECENTTGTMRGLNPDQLLGRSERLSRSGMPVTFLTLAARRLGN